ncbi:hypothetical protein ANN_04642 [Periplaneta americana]|uniref:Uncharacterized protein n=1 Tax=Periplaneta americana TaxID=6978 RepID=A0ABQ8T8Z8_PERAM|nr:hypothetical protein ANN_04642 [Periplaneta americana]
MRRPRGKQKIGKTEECWICSERPAHGQKMYVCTYVPTYSRGSRSEENSSIQNTSLNDHRNSRTEENVPLLGFLIRRPLLSVSDEKDHEVGNSLRLRLCLDVKLSKPAHMLRKRAYCAQHDRNILLPEFSTNSDLNHTDVVVAAAADRTVTKGISTTNNKAEVMRFLRSVLGITRYDKISNAQIRSRLQIKGLKENIDQYLANWTQDTNRIDNNGLVHYIMTYKSKRTTLLNMPLGKFRNKKHQQFGSTVGKQVIRGATAYEGSRPTSRLLASRSHVSAGER